MKEYLTPSIDDLRLECVLMQAWKKTSAYLRSHSWYADILGLDYQSLRIPQFIAETIESLQNPEEWIPEPIHLVPAPKNQRWEFRGDEWQPCGNIREKIRPLAHVGLQDQVVATALMMCLADRVETDLGDPRLSPDIRENRESVIAYGHRLVCDREGHELQHRWGSTKLYRQYFQDYRTFLERSQIVTEQLSAPGDDSEIAIVQSDISKFYDRVRPRMLIEKLRNLSHSPRENSFFYMAERVLDWKWGDERWAEGYAKQQNIQGFKSVALPQGLVASGFFANVALRDFCQALRRSQGRALESSEDITLEDACIYVDDIRLVLRVTKGVDEEDIKTKVIGWLQGILDRTAHGLLIETSKTEVTVEGRERRFLVQQSKAANRIQGAVSGAFDMLHGTDLIGAIEGFFHTQKRYSSDLMPEDNGRTGLLVGTSDMRDDTAARFAAGKFRRTFRSLRPLLAEELGADEISGDDGGSDDHDEGHALPVNLVLTKQQLDERAKLFSALLIEEWTTNPGNVRLLRIALDVYPDAEFLNQVLNILRPGWQIQGSRGPRREVRIYCLAELFRAGATETGAVKDGECLPKDVSIDEYHHRLIAEAADILASFISNPSPGTRFPWYLMQQVFIYLIARNEFPETVSTLGSKGGQLMSHYREFTKFLTGHLPHTIEKHAIFLAIAQTGFHLRRMDQLVQDTGISEEFLIRLHKVSPPVAAELWLLCQESASEILERTAFHLGLSVRGMSTSENNLATMSAKSENPFFEEENLLVLAEWLLNQPAETFENTVTPWQIGCNMTSAEGYRFGKIEPLSFDLTEKGRKAAYLFEPPDWCESV